MNRQARLPRRKELAWLNELNVPGAVGQVLINGATTVLFNQGIYNATVPVQDGENRVQAQIMSSTGRPGTWRFSFPAVESFLRRSFRVIEGQAVDITEHSITFRLRGEPGEKVQFTFQAVGSE